MTTHFTESHCPTARPRPTEVSAATIGQLAEPQRQVTDDLSGGVLADELQRPAAAGGQRAADPAAATWTGTVCSSGELITARAAPSRAEVKSAHLAALTQAAGVAKSGGGPGGHRRVRS